jgi:tetratricopeptide (TPR) repeat protein
MGEQLAWTQVRSNDDQSREVGRGLGELKAKKPGASDELKGAVRLKSHRVQVRIVSNFVRTQVEEVFLNDTNDVLEGIYRFPLPSDAKIEALALDVGDKLEQGAFVDRDRAAAIWRGAIVNATPVHQRQPLDDIVWVPGPWRDPALLEWQRGGRFELRVYPIPKRGSRRIVLAYTQISSPSGDARRYTYPLPYDPSAASRVAAFDADIQVRGNDADYGVRPIGYTMQQSLDSGVTRLWMAESDFIPHGDLALEYALPNADAEFKAWAYAVSQNPSSSIGSSTIAQRAPVGYVAFSLRPAWTRDEPEAARDVVLIVDTSRSMLGENLRRAQQLASRLLADLEPADRGSLLACDSSCEVLPEGLLPAGPELTEAANRFLSSMQAEGASDPTAAVRAALVLGEHGRSERPLSIVYIGDGTPTVGPIRPGTIEKMIEHDLADSSAKVIAVGVGGESDLDTLGALARGGGGVVVNLLPGKSLDEVACNVVSAVRGTHLSQVSVGLPEGLVDIVPRRPDPLRSNTEMWVLARMQRSNIHGDVVLRGRLGKAPFERRWPIDLVATNSNGNAFVPRLFAAARIAELERMGDADSKREVIELSQVHHVASRYTSLLVLESEAMFKAFRLNKSEPKQDWTGESDDEQQVLAEDAQAQSVGAGRAAPASAPKATTMVGKGAADQLATAPSAPKRAMRESVAPREYATPPAASPSEEASARSRDDEVFVSRPRSTPRWTMIPMRRVWERKGSFSSEHVPADANLRALTKAEAAFESEPERRSALKTLLSFYQRRGEFDHANLLIGRWSEKEPLDPDALTARADAAANRGQRSDAIRLLGSVIDARPDDVKAQQRLARLYRWSGELEQSCRYWVALTEFHTDKAEWLVQAVRCTRATDRAWLADYLLDNASDPVRRQATHLLERAPEPINELSGDLRAEAAWSGDADIDIAFITPEGQRVSWLGAPTRQVISAQNVTSRRNEGLALRNAPAGNYVIQLVRVTGVGTIQGELLLTVADHKRSVPFTLKDERAVVGVASIKVVPKLIPIW